MFKKILKTVCSLLLTAVLLFGALPVSAENKSDFSGKRTVVYSVDSSDLDNYINGGRAAFNLILRSKIPSFVNYSFSSDERDVNLILSFDFDSYSDYAFKASQMINREPYNYYKDGKEIILLEGNTPYDMLNFVSGSLSDSNALLDKTLDEIFTVSSNRIEINGKKYDFKDAICILPKGHNVIKLDSLNIETIPRKDGTYTRIITASSGRIKALQEKFKQNGKIKRDGNEVSVKFSANSIEELGMKTMQCLEVTVYSCEYQECSDKKVLITRTDYIDTKNILQKDANFSYNVKLPDYAENVKSIDDTCEASDTGISSNDNNKIKFKYERDFKFTSVNIITEYMNSFNRVKRSVVFSAPTSIAEHFHNDIKKKLSKKVKSGMVFDIYNENGNRCYRISIVTMLQDDLIDFDKELLGYRKGAEREKSFLPYGTEEISDSFKIDFAKMKMLPPDRITATYILPKFSKIGNGLKSDVLGKIENGKIKLVYSINSSDRINLEYTCFNILNTVLYGLALILFAVLFFVIKSKVKKLKAKKLSARSTQAAQTSQFFVQSQLTQPTEPIQPNGQPMK